MGKAKLRSEKLKRIKASAAKSRTLNAAKSFIADAGQRCQITAEQSAEGDQPAKLATFSGLGYTGGAMTPEGWETPIVVDLEGINQRQDQPVLRQHDHEQIVGHTTSVKITKAGIEYEGVFSGEPQHVSKVTHLGKNNFPWQLSIGADPVRGSLEFLDAGETATVNGREVSGPLYISRKTNLREISFVPLGADDLTTATIAASSRKVNKVDPKIALKFAMSLQGSKARFSDEDIEKMDGDEAKAALKKCMKAADDDDADDNEKKKADEDEKNVKSSSKQLDTFKRDMEKMHADFLAGQAREIRRQNDIIATVKACGITGRIPLTNDRGDYEKDASGNEIMIDLAAHALEKGWSAEQTQLKAKLHQLRESRPGAGVGVPGGLGYSTSNPILNDAVIEAAILDHAASAGQFQLWDDSFYESETSERCAIPNRVKARIKADLNDAYTDQIRSAARKHFPRGIGLHQMLSFIASQNGYRGGEMIRGSSQLGEVMHYASRNRIQAEGASTSSLPNLLANVLNKFMLQGYMFAEQSFQEISGKRTVTDFKPTKSINLFGDTILKKLGPTGEISHGTLYDQAFANQAYTWARLLGIPEQTIVNDDIGGLTQVPMILGRGAALAVNDVFWTLFLNPGYDDGGSTNFFAATHTITGQSGNSNYQSGAGTALSSDSLKSAVVLFDNQIDPKGFPIGIDPKILLVGPDTHVAGKELMQSDRIIMGGLASTSSASKQPQTNIWQNEFKLVKSRYINKSAYTGYSTTAWWLLADPGLMPVIEIAYLGGEAPQVEMAGKDFQFDQLGITTRVVLRFGCSMQNFRGGVKSAGA